MIWSSPSIIFQWEFSCDGDCVIQRPYFDNLSYGHHQASFFGENSVMTVTVSSGDYILIIYDMSSPSIIFWWEFSHDSDSVIWRLYFDNIWYSHHQASFFSENSVVMVILSFENYILITYDMVITKHNFSVQIEP